MDEPQEVLAWCLANWHKVLVVIIALIHVWKFFFDYVRPIAKKDKEEMLIKIPKEGVKITIEPLDPKA
jgi:hypothetical protein